MPNWCSTTYICVGNPIEIRQLHKAIVTNMRRKTSRVKNEFGTLWLGNIIDQLGGNWKDWRCRGSILNYYIERASKVSSNKLVKLTIYQTTAWNEQEGFRKFIEQKFPSIKVYYLEIEPEDSRFRTNDDTGNYFPDRYLIDTHCGIKMFKTLEKVAEFASEKIERTVDANVGAIKKALDDIVFEVDSEEEDIFYEFHEIQVIP